MTGLGLIHSGGEIEREFWLSPFGHLGKNVTAKILGETNSQNLMRDEKIIKKWIKFVSQVSSWPPLSHPAISLATPYP